MRTDDLTAFCAAVVSLALTFPETLNSWALLPVPPREILGAVPFWD